MKLKWHKQMTSTFADMGRGRSARITKQLWRRRRPWLLTMQGPDATGGYFEARFSTQRDAKVVAALMCD